MEQLFKANTIAQRKIMEWLVQQGITGADIASVNLSGSAMARITNPAGQYMDLYYDKQSGVRVLNITAEREDELAWYWGNETNEVDTQEWRDELTADEAAMVAQWDKRYAKGFETLVQKIVDLEDSRNIPLNHYEPEL